MRNLLQAELLKNSENILKLATNFSPSYQAAMKNALQFFENTGLPTKSNEDWKLTNIALNLAPRFYEYKEEIENRMPDTEVDSILKNILDMRGMIIFTNGIFNRFLSVLPPGIEMDALSLETDFVDAFDSLNFGVALAPLTIKIKKNAVIDFPISIVHTVNDKSVNKIISPRLTIVAEPHSEACFLEVFTTTQADRKKEKLQYTTNAVTHFILQENASVEHVKIQNEAHDALHIGLSKAQLFKGSRFASVTADFGLLMARHNLQVDLLESGTETSVHGIFALNKLEHTDIFSQIIHHASHTTSEQLFKGILGGESRGVFTGKIIVKKDAQQSSSSQLNKNLLLSHKAHIDTRPQLLVHADDVKCSHGATVGQLSEEEEFYLESRGISKERAKAMLCHGFLAEVILKINNPLIRLFAENMLFLNLSTIMTSEK